MKTREATIKYNEAENQAKIYNPDQGFIARAKSIEKILIAEYGEDEADDIFDLVFENEIN